MEVTIATDAEARKRLEALFVDSPLLAWPPTDLLFNLGLFTRASVLVKYLVMDDLYRRIVGIPGALVEFGVWRGQNLVLLENMRAIHEPFNKDRRIIGFDSFNGYEDGTYRAGPDYADTLRELLKVHEECNAFGHLSGRHEIVAGDVEQTAPAYFGPGYTGFVALAIFDMGPYKPTIEAMRAILPHLLPGSVLLLDELSHPGEARAFKDVFGGFVDYKIEKVALYPSKTSVTIL